jgi:hypothetical protein
MALNIKTGTNWLTCQAVSGKALKEQRCRPPTAEVILRGTIATRCWVQNSLRALQEIRQTPRRIFRRLETDARAKNPEEKMKLLKELQVILKESHRVLEEIHKKQSNEK